MPTYVNHVCQFCQQTFNVLLKEHNRGGGLYCSKKCVSESLKKTRINNEKCNLCNAEFYITNSRKKASKSQFVFCSRKCKNKAQAIGNGFDSMLPSHYGLSDSGKSETYRRIAFENHPNHCHDCQWNVHLAVLDVHHIDLNRKNNSPENLMILCPTCHTVRHYLDGTGRYKGKTGGQCENRTHFASV